MKVTSVTNGAGNPIGWKVREEGDKPWAVPENGQEKVRKGKG
jgi:hypothetical protein